MIDTDSVGHSPLYWLGVLVIGAALGLLSGVVGGTVLRLFGMP